MVLNKQNVTLQLTRDFLHKRNRIACVTLESSKSTAYFDKPNVDKHFVQVVNQPLAQKKQKKGN